MTAQYRRVGHVTRMDDTCLPKIISTPSLNMAPAPMVVSWRGTKICWRSTWDSATCSLRSSSTSRQTGHRGGLYSRSRYLSSSAAVYSYFKTSVFNARLAVNCRRTARGFTCDICSRVCASRIGLISHQRIHLWSRGPSCRRRHGSVQQQPFSIHLYKRRLDYCDVLSNSLTAKTEFPQSSLPVKLCVRVRILR